MLNEKRYEFKLCKAEFISTPEYAKSVLFFENFKLVCFSLTSYNCQVYQSMSRVPDDTKFQSNKVCFSSILLYLTDNELWVIDAIKILYKNDFKWDLSNED